MGERTETERTKISLRGQDTYDISDHLYGIFLEDIGFSVDGGLNANMVNNYSFDGVYLDRQEIRAVEEPLRYWRFEGGRMTSGTEKALSKNSKYARIVVREKASLINYGYSGQQKGWEIPSMSIKEGQTYTFSALVRNRTFNGKIGVQAVNGRGEPLTEEAFCEISEELGISPEPTPVLETRAQGWVKISLSVTGTKEAYGKLRIAFAGDGELWLDCVDFHSDNLWHAGDPKWRHGHLRRDLVETLVALHPRFMRFPGGCIVEGLTPGNEYNWKHTVGELWERKSNYNLWSEKLPDGGYNQSYQIGFYEYFCLCEDLGMMPLPTLSAGMNCQIRVRQYKLKENTMIPLESPEFDNYIVDNYLDLIAFANGDPKENRWAALRAKMGHPAPFGLKYIGVGNENWGRDYLKRYDHIAGAIHEKYPKIQCMICCGFTPIQAMNRSVWNHVKKYHPGVIADEHAYHSPEWFIKSAGRFDHYDRKRGKIYMGEYSANGMMAGKKMTVENSNCLDSALGEAAFMTGMERNGDVVEMASYAPLLNLAGSEQWYANLIDFNPATVSPTVNYWNQALFSNYYGPKYVPFSGKLPKGVFLSVTRDEEHFYVKAVNTTDADAQLELEGLEAGDGTYSAECLGGTALDVRNEVDFAGASVQKLKPEPAEVSVEQGHLVISLAGRRIFACKLPMAEQN